MLLDNGADVHGGGESPLQNAAGHGHPETVALLIGRGADAWSQAAMWWATMYRHNAVVALLMERRGGGTVVIYFSD